VTAFAQPLVGALFAAFRWRANLVALRLQAHRDQTRDWMTLKTRSAASYSRLRQAVSPRPRSSRSSPPVAHCLVIAGKNARHGQAICFHRSSTEGIEFARAVRSALI
jgi:hypothetical protein